MLDKKIIIEAFHDIKREMYFATNIQERANLKELLRAMLTDYDFLLLVS